LAFAFACPEARTDACAAAEPSALARREAELAAAVAARAAWLAPALACCDAVMAACARALAVTPAWVVWRAPTWAEVSELSARATPADTMDKAMPKAIPMIRTGSRMMLSRCLWARGHAGSRQRARGRRRPI